MSSILITGGAGYIGSHTAFYMAQKGFEVIILDKYVHSQEFNPSWAKVIKSDISDQNVLDDIFSNYNIDAVMHFAASIEVSESIKHPIEFYNNNVSTTLKLLEVMVKHNINKFIFSSSCAVYGNPEVVPILESHDANPITPYGRSKLMIENILKDLNDAYGFLYISLRYFNVAGALPEHCLGEQHTPETHLIPILLNAALTNKPFTIYGVDYPTKDGTCVRDFLHVLDVAEAHYLALNHLNMGNPSDCFNLGTGKGFSVKEIITSIENLYRTKLQVINAKRRSGDPAILIADAMKANTILKWKPKFTNLDFILRSAYLFQNSIKKQDQQSRKFV